MSRHQPISDTTTAFRKILHLMARPAKGDKGRGGVLIQPFRGYGSREEIYLMGRVFLQPDRPVESKRGTVGRDLMDMGRRLMRKGIPDAVVKADYLGTVQQVKTDPDGYFRIHLRPESPPPEDRLWHEMQLELIKPDAAAPLVTGEFFVPPNTSRHVIISDIDDTVMLTGVANKLKMFWRLFMKGAQSRVAFPGVAALYHALHCGKSGADNNPMLYVSRGPWGIYDVLEAFFNLHEIPEGPILFLREWGISLRRPFPRKSKDHKRNLIRTMLSLYSDLPFVLIGDSGQHDPEIYADIVKEYPGRVKAIYIRNVSRKPERQEAIEKLAVELMAAGSSLLLAADSFAIARHAADLELISPEALADVLSERRAQEGEVDLQPTLAVPGTSPEETREEIEKGGVEEALQEDTQEDAPPNNVLVDPETEK